MTPLIPNIINDLLMIFFDKTAIAKPMITYNMLLQEFSIPSFKRSIE